MTKPLLSIGIIFKNEIRCIERCLKSLQSLREAIPCEVVMADTGSDDGSRAVAERYADILIDFPWIGDFSAARNAVMDRCSGTWYMTIDCDEWVDSNIEGLVVFLTGEYDFDFASVVIRNYDTRELDKGGSYSDFLATRLLRMSTGLRYEGTVHEHWHYKGDLRTMMIRGAVFHHDGYVYQNKELLKEKQKERWAETPIQALDHALERGVRFPLPDKLMNIDEMDTLASRLAQDQGRLVPLSLHAAQILDVEDWQQLFWVRGLLLAAVSAYPWSSKEQDEEQSMALAKAFAKLEREFLPRCYVPEILRADRLYALPPLHRFGWYCAQAFDTLEQGDAVEYVRLLRCGLDVCQGVKDMVEFLINHTAEVQRLTTPPELKALADQVRVILARFSPDDPAIVALKQSEAYQKVAHLIEGTAVPVWGGLPQ